MRKIEIVPMLKTPAIVMSWITMAVFALNIWWISTGNASGLNYFLFGVFCLASAQWFYAFSPKSLIEKPEWRIQIYDDKR